MSNLVSILLPNYNKAPYLRETLDSVITQTYTNWECIIVDDHSTDNSWEILEEYSKKDLRFKIFKRPENRRKGGNAARNYAFEMSKGEFINWFDSDDIMHPRMIESKIDKAIQYLNLDFTFGDILKFHYSTNDAKKVDKIDYEFYHSNLPLAYLKGTFWIPICSPLFSRKFLEEFENLFDEYLMRGQEAEFFTRILLNKPNFLFVKDSLNFWRQSNDSKTGAYKGSSIEIQQLSNFLSYKKIYLNFVKRGELSKEEREYFKWIFGVFLTTIRIMHIEYFRLLKFGISYNTFPSYFFILKVLAFRLLNSMGVIKRPN
jgi:glycosyltransferase involved in cell wall biosynthesis